MGPITGAGINVLTDLSLPYTGRGPCCYGVELVDLAMFLHIGERVFIYICSHMHLVCFAGSNVRRDSETVLTHLLPLEQGKGAVNDHLEG